MSFKIPKIKYEEILAINYNAIKLIYLPAIIFATPGKGIAASEWKIDIMDATVVIYNEKWGDVIKFLEYGTKPHIITPKNKKALVFKLKEDDRVIITQKVKHPGIASRKFIREIINNQNLENQYHAYVDAEIQKLLDK